MYQYPDSPPVVRVVLAQTDCSLGHNMHYFPKHQTGIPQTTRGKGTKHDRVTFQLIVESSVNEVKSQVLTQVFRFIKFLVTTRKDHDPLSAACEQEGLILGTWCLYGHLEDRIT